jgi:hypothetical protein
MTHQQKPLVRRTTAMTDAFVRAFADKGVDLPALLDGAGVKMPVKREPVWRVTRREGKGGKRK